MAGAELPHLPRLGRTTRCLIPPPTSELQTSPPTAPRAHASPKNRSIDHITRKILADSVRTEETHTPSDLGKHADSHVEAERHQCLSRHDPLHDHGGRVGQQRRRRQRVRPRPTPRPWCAPGPGCGRGRPRPGGRTRPGHLGLRRVQVIGQGAPPALRQRVVAFSTTPLRLPCCAGQMSIPIRRTSPPDRTWR